MEDHNYKIRKASFPGKDRLNGTEKPFCRASHGNKLRQLRRFCNGPRVTTAQEILDNNVNPGQNVLVISGGMTGVETADYMGEHGKAVTILEMRPDIALDEAPTPRAFLMPRLADRGIQKIVNATVKKFTEDGVVYEQFGQEYTIVGFDTIVLAMGVKPYNPLEEAAGKVCDEVYVVGDAKEAGPANKATEAGLAAALAL